MAGILSIKGLAYGWAAVAATAAAGAGVLQLSYVPPVPAAVAAPKPVPPVPATVAEVSPPAPKAAVPFENRALVAALPPPHAVPSRPAAPLPVPPVPPPWHPARVVTRAPQHRGSGPELPAYAEPSPYGIPAYAYGYASPYDDYAPAPRGLGPRYYGWPPG